MSRTDRGVEWLLSSNDPSVRYLTLTEVLGTSPRSRAVRDAREAIPSGPRVRALLRQRQDGGFGVHPYAKWTGSFWRLVSLVELAIPPGHPGVAAAAEEVLACWHYDVLFGLLVLSRCGKVTDPRAAEALDLIEAKRGNDGCWKADGRPYWRRPGSEGSNVEVVDWGRSGPNEMVTLNALRTLRAAGRLRL